MDMTEEELERQMMAALEAEMDGTADGGADGAADGAVESAVFPEMVQVPKIAPASPPAAGAGAGYPADFTALMDLQLPCYFELGSTRLSVAEVLGLQRGSVIQLEKMMGEPGKFVVGGRDFARAEVVQLASGHYGIRLTEIIGNAPGREG